MSVVYALACPVSHCARICPAAHARLPCSCEGAFHTPPFWYSLSLDIIVMHNCLMLCAPTHHADMLRHTGLHRALIMALHRAR
jgi:hypothetical protein